MYERFTDSARRMVAIAEGEAFGRGATRVAPEDVLIALAHDHGVAGSVLRAVAADPALLRDGLLAIEPATAPTVDQARPLPLAHSTVEAFALAAREADGFGLARVGTEHLLLGVLRESTGRVFRLLVAVRRDPGLIRDCTFDLVASPGFVSPEQPSAAAPDPSPPPAPSVASTPPAPPPAPPPATTYLGGPDPSPTAPAPASAEGFGAGDRALVVQLVAEVARLRDEVASLRVDLARGGGPRRVREDHEDHEGRMLA